MTTYQDNPLILPALFNMLTWLIDIMQLLHDVHDEEQFQLAHKHASELGLKIQQLLENQAQVSKC